MKATTSDGIHDGGVVDDLNFEAEFFGSVEEVDMGGSAEGVAYDQKRKMLVLVFRLCHHLETVVDSNLDVISPHDGYFLLVEFFENLHIHSQDGGLGLEIHLFGFSDNLEPPDRDVFVVTKTKANEVEGHNGGSLKSL